MSHAREALPVEHPKRGWAAGDDRHAMGLGRPHLRRSISGGGLGETYCPRFPVCMAR